MGAKTYWRYSKDAGRAQKSPRETAWSAKPAGCLSSLFAQECPTSVTSLATLENLYNSVFSWVSPPPKNTHVVIYDFGLPSNSFSRQVDPLENTFMQLLHDGNDFLVPHGHGAATFHQTPAWWWHIVPLPIQNHFSYSFLTTLLFNLSIFSALNFRAPCSLPQRK